MSMLIHIPADVAEAVPPYHPGVEPPCPDVARKAARDVILQRETDPLWQSLAYWEPA